MKKLVFFVLLAALSINSAFAGKYADALSGCLAKSTTPKDRTDLARWVFSVLSVHPELADLSAVTQAKREQINQNTGKLVTRVIADSCTKEFKETSINEGPDGVNAALQSLAALSLQELMSNPKVEGELTGVAAHLDLLKLSGVFQ